MADTPLRCWDMVKQNHASTGYVIVNVEKPGEKSQMPINTGVYFSGAYSKKKINILLMRSMDTIEENEIEYKLRIYTSLGMYSYATLTVKTADKQKTVYKTGTAPSGETVTITIKC